MALQAPGGVPGCIKFTARCGAPPCGGAARSLLRDDDVLALHAPAQQCAPTRSNPAAHDCPDRPCAQAPSHPAGLKNLGNTCYVNSALQFLGALPAFKGALYRLEEALAGQPIMQELR